ncbi:C-5 sterol desaturase [Histoplasma mississippiense (nom. inval.)]|uniref:C-5 sterol desaturase n=1 Tax=Ajellomyces capsulatus (strain NAm1 / WU24) TaxID=2059318 RepID=UPI000157CA18|nr:C-5 sterol desaturase [Histoplasma mississippiense (nom. inval.)]EDN09721.1 C-5 sterol desaturase [Histoplasma mississippiense (nom. inval.)]
MDVILEVFDTLIFDYFYAKLSSAKDASAISSRFNNSLNETKYDFVGAGGYVYQPTTTYFKLQPSIYAYTSSLPRDYIWRQLFTLYIITWVFGLLVYFIFATISYVFVFDKSTFNHPKYLKNQIRMEIKQTSIALPIMAIFTAPVFLLEVRGYAKINLPMSSFLSSSTSGTVLIHDGEYVANSPIINGAACHTMHHLYFNFNYGQFTTIWDRLGGSYRKPNIELFHKETKMAKEEWERQVKEMESRVQAVEGKDDRTYVTDVDADVKESKKML